MMACQLYVVATLADMSRRPRTLGGNYIGATRGGTLWHAYSTDLP